MDITKAVTAEDFHAFRALLDEMATWDAAETSALGFDPTALLEMCYSGDSGALQQAFSLPRTAMYLAREGGAVVGCAGYENLGEDIAEVTKVFVRPTNRGFGTGRALLAHVMDAISGEGYRHARLETTTFMTTAVASYAKFGFQRCDPFRPPMGGLGPITVFMQREI